MQISVIIPTYQRPAKIAACVAALARQSLDPGAYEVLVGLDGHDPEAGRAAERAWSEAGGQNLRVVECEKMGLAAVRNRLLEAARGRIMLSTNDDVLAERRFLEAHVRAHAEAGRTVVVSGSSPWVVHEPDRMFDRLIRETSMVFFYPAMDTAEAGADRGRDWGFRHAWGLNMSTPMDAAREVGGFGVYPAKYGYEDNEFAFKLAQKYGAPVLYRPEAVAWHDHRMEPREYAEREYKLGYAAWGFAGQCPECALAMFRRDIRSESESDYSVQYVERERQGAAVSMMVFARSAELPAAALDGQHGGALREIAYQQHLAMKRWLWRRGLCDAIEGRAIDATGAFGSISTSPPITDASRVNGMGANDYAAASVRGGT